MMLSLQAVPYATWKNNAIDTRRLKRAAEKVLKRWEMMAISVPFQSWADNVAEKQRLKRAAQRVVGRWQQLAISVPFATWHDNVSEKKRLQRAARARLQAANASAADPPKAAANAEEVENARGGDEAG